MIRGFRFALVSGAVLLAAGALPAQQARTPRPAIRLNIPALADGGRLPDGYSCVAESAALRPQIQWSGTTPAVVSFVFLMHDADVHPGRGMYDNTHWIVWNIPGDATEISEGSPVGPLPEGSVIGKNTSGMPPGFAREAAYAPPCAPPGNPHHYWFELFALDTTLDLPATATRAEVIAAMDTHVVGKAVYTALFNRPQP